MAPLKRVNQSKPKTERIQNKGGGNLKRKNEGPLLGDDDDFGDYISTDAVDENTASVGGVHLEDEDAFELGTGDYKAEQKAAARTQGQAKHSKKQKVSQKRSAGDTDEDTPALAVGDALATKKKKKKVKRQPAAEFEAQRAVAADIAGRHAAEQAAWLRDSWRACTGASNLETEVISEAAVVALPEEGSFEDWLKLAAGSSAAQLAGEGLPPGSPAAILVSSAAMGAVGLIKLLPGLNKVCRIAKLFAKHFKVAEQQKLLQGTVVGMASGTPNRLCKLADMDALKLDHLQLLVLDVHLDAKQRTILDILETRRDFWDFVSKHVVAGMAAGRTKVLLVDGEKLKC
ncbi:g2732 [Coccomyxa elongata]